MTFPTRTGSMRHEIRDTMDGTVVSLVGDIDLESSPAARNVLLECVGRGRRMVVDMSLVTYIDSSGVASLVEAFQSARKARIGFALVAVSPAAMRVLGLARLDKVFPIHASAKEAFEG